jgi:hypothetical protein
MAVLSGLSLPRDGYLEERPDLVKSFLKGLRKLLEDMLREEELIGGLNSESRYPRCMRAGFGGRDL